MEKNTGKTECLNYVLGHLPESLKTAVTSIGIDGERVDQVTRTAKPEIYLREGIYFGTAEKHYSLKNMVAEVCDISRFNTSLGRIVTARCVTGGKVLLSGPSSTCDLEQWMQSLHQFGMELTIIDGALSRLSSASPAISESLILATGAALSANMPGLVGKTAFTVEMIDLPLCSGGLPEMLKDKEDGIYVSYDGIGFEKLELKSSFMLDSAENGIPEEAVSLYLTGALTDRFLKKVRISGKDKTIIVKDFTKIFITPGEYRAFIRAGGRIEVTQRTNLIAICVNPVSPSGYRLDSGLLREKITEATGYPAYDLRMI